MPFYLTPEQDDDFDRAFSLFSLPDCAVIDESYDG